MTALAYPCARQGSTGLRLLLAGILLALLAFTAAAKTAAPLASDPALDALIRHQVTLRGVANGQRVPEDWQNPDASALVRMSMGSQSKSAYDPQSTDLGLYFSQISTRGIDLGGAHV